MGYLLDYQLFPSARVEELLSDVFGCELSEATLYNSREHCFEKLASEAAITGQIQHPEVLHCDDTGMRVKGKLWWLHVARTDGLTFYFVHTKRGRDAMDILPHYNRGVVK